MGTSQMNCLINLKHILIALTPYLVNVALAFALRFSVIFTKRFEEKLKKLSAGLFFTQMIAIT